MVRAAVFHVKHCRLFCGACTDSGGTRRAVSANFRNKEKEN